MRSLVLLRCEKALWFSQYTPGEMREQLALGLDVCPIAAKLQPDHKSRELDPSWGPPPPAPPLQQGADRKSDRLSIAIQAAAKLSPSELLLLQDAIAGLSQALREQAPVEVKENRSLSCGKAEKSAQPSGGYFELKKIGRHGPYLYLRWRSAGKLRSTYLGKITDS